MKATTTLFVSAIFQIGICTNKDWDAKRKKCASLPVEFITKPDHGKPRHYQNDKGRKRRAYTEKYHKSDVYRLAEAERPKHILEHKSILETKPIIDLQWIQCKSCDAKWKFFAACKQCNGLGFIGLEDKIKALSKDDVKRLLKTLGAQANASEAAPRKLALWRIVSAGYRRAERYGKRKRLVKRERCRKTQDDSKAAQRKLKGGEIEKLREQLQGNCQWQYDYDIRYKLEMIDIDDFWGDEFYEDAKSDIKILSTKLLELGLSESELDTIKDHEWNNLAEIYKKKANKPNSELKRKCFFD